MPFQPPTALASCKAAAGWLNVIAAAWMLAGFSLRSEAAAGTWTPLAHLPPSSSGGVMLLLSDGTVMVKSFAGGGDGYGNTWYKLTPDSAGSYVNGTWSTLAAMSNTRLYFSSQVLRDGRVFVAGGEYGTGKAAAETYNPLTNTWTAAPAPGHSFDDSNSDILPDGRVLVSLVEGSLRSTLLFDPASNTWAAGPDANGIHNESAWVKLPDESILMVDRLSTSSERYIPSLNQWVIDATVPVSLYDPFGLETGAAVLLPDGRALFLGSPSVTALYTPSGATSPGTWATGPAIPNNLGAPDAAAAVMVNGKVLCALSPTPTSADHFPTPTTFWEFDPGSNSFTQILAPNGGNSIGISSYATNVLDLPDGTVLYSSLGASQYYVYTPNGGPLAAWKPTISGILKNLDGSFHLAGTKLNGISQGAAYGDDWQMATNYPLVRLTSAGNVYYARTYNWSSTGVSTGVTPVTTEFAAPAGLPAGNYSLVVVANGISSDPVSFNPANALSISVAASADEGDAPLTATLSATWAPPSDVVVNLSSSITAAATVPASVTLPSGQTSVTFPVTIIDDAVLNGTRNVILTASATGYATGTAPLAVNDNETATLTVSVPASATEGVGTVTGTVTCSAAPATAVTVNLSSSDTTAAQVPATVIIPAGQLSVNFSITIVDDNKIDGTQTAVIRATVTNWPDEAASINVLDNENTNLALTVPSTVTEGGAAGGTVSISGILPTALTVSLASSNTSRLTVTASVTVAAGSTSAPFTLVAPNNSLTDGSASVTITATAPGFTGANATTSVLDNDVHHFAVAAIGTPQVKGVPFSVTLTAKDINNVTLGTYNGTPGLSAAGSGGADLISPTVTSAFSAGVWTGNVTVNTFDSNVVLTVSDGSGHSGASNSFNVTAGALHHFAWSTVTGTKVAGTPFSATVTAQDVASNTATNFTGTANLSGYFTNSAGSSVVITEVNPNTPDEVEFTNVSSAPVNISGWTIHLYDDTSWPSPLGAFTIPAGSTCAVGQVFRLQEFGTAPGSFPVFSFGANISWTPAASSKVAVMIRDSNGNIVDFVCVGAATPSSITLPVTVPASKWTGATVTATTSTTLDYARIGGSDGNTASDWTIAATGMGAVNPGLTLPFPAAYPAVTVAPSATGNFAAGVWTGNITVTQGATQLQLRADDGAGHTGDSNAFNVLSNDANLSALVLAGGTPSPPFNSANTSYTASVSNGTGSITVTPTASNANATLQARVNGGAYAAVSSGSPSSSLALNVGANPVDVQVTAQDGVTVKVYSVTVTRNTLYQDWTGGYGMSGINANADADYDGDGLRNLLEWGFGTDPTSDTLGMVSISGATVTSHGSPAVWVVPHGGGGADYFAMFGRRKNAAAAGLTYTVEFSADLSFWAASADTPTVLASDAEIDVVTVPFPATVNGQPARFFHVKISGP